MRWSLLLVCLVVSGLCASAVAQSGVETKPTVAKFDPTRDPVKDLAAALDKAKESGRHVLLDVGGEWCSWCHLMDKFMEENAPLKALRKKAYVMLKINFSPENKNEVFLAKYPKITGYPHLYVLDATGKLLHSQDTAELEEGKGYHLGRFTAFLNKWAPKGK